MGLELRRGRNGELRGHWYGRYDVDGKAHVVNLGVPIVGTPPPSGRIAEDGDAAFERSRARAEAKLEAVRAEAGQKGRTGHLVERMIEQKTGQTVEHVRIVDLFRRWSANSPGCEQHKKHAGASFAQFTEHVQTAQAGAVLCYEVTRATVENWAEHLRATFTPGVARRKLRLVKNAFGRALPVGASNPFDPLPWTHGEGAGEEMPRRPLSGEQLQRLIDTAKLRAPILYPLIVCAAYSALRRGDVCRLQWAAVDLSANELLVRTAKTGERVVIPILPLLRDVLTEAAANRKPGAIHVWPLAARMIENNPNGLTLPFKRIATEAAGYVITQEEPERDGGTTPLADILPDVEKAVAGRYRGEKLDRVTGILRRYAAGASAKQIGRETGRQTARITETLQAAERWAGRRFMPEPNNVVKRRRMIAEATRCDRPHGARAASLIDWHCLRTTFVTRALCGGMRIEDLRTITGHRLVETVLKHYYRPPTAHIRVALEKAMLPTGADRPALATGADPLTEITDKLQNLKPADRARLAKMMKGA